jgi:hypothetical protein
MKNNSVIGKVDAILVLPNNEAGVEPTLGDTASVLRKCCLSFDLELPFKNSYMAEKCG